MGLTRSQAEACGIAWPAGTPRKARVRIPDATGGMNKTEAAYAHFLDARILKGEVARYRFDSFRLRLAKNTHLQVDFYVLLADGSIALVDVKGRKKFQRTDGTHYHGPFVEEDAICKLKVAAAMYPEFTHYLTWPDGRGGWETREL